MARGKLTRRESVILLLSFVWMGHGLLMIVHPEPVVTEEALPHELIDPLLRGLVWVGVAVLAPMLLLMGRFYQPASTSRVVQKASRFSRFSAELLGWQLLELPIIIRIASNAWSALMWLIPGSPAGSPGALPAILMWLAVLALIIIASGWPEAGYPEARKKSSNA